MTLKRKFLLQNLLLVLALLAAGTVAVWRLRAVGPQVQVAPYAYTQLRTAELAAANVATVKGLLATAESARVNREEIIDNLDVAIRGLDEFIDANEEYVAPDADAERAYAILIGAAVVARDDLRAVLKKVEDAANAPLSDADRTAQIARVDDAAVGLDAIARGCVGYMRVRNEGALGLIGTTSLIIALLFAAVVVAATLLSVWQYRSVMLPLQRLREGVRNVAQAKFSEPISGGANNAASSGHNGTNGFGSREFAELAAEFDRMARELDGFYRQLEEKVNAKSKELVRSERLASVGFLAAGVAHEINNPLNIISGYAELTSKRLWSAAEEAARGGDADAACDAAREACQSLQIIRDEAFRCKEITEKLLSLTRGGGDDTREVLAIDEVAADVAQMTRGLKRYRDRHLELKFDAGEPLRVVANLNEMKQVLLNLTVNALEATRPGEGEVRIEGRRNNGWVEVSVVDNGRGITSENLKHVFEPFFTAKRGAGEPGTGLGLSITHAIVEGHGGTIRAESEGPGRGARFTVQLPVKASKDGHGDTTTTHAHAGGAGGAGERNPAGAAV